MKDLTDLELTAIYAALVHSIYVCDIFKQQTEELKQSSDIIMNKAGDEMERRGLLEEDKPEFYLKKNYE